MFESLTSISEERTEDGFIVAYKKKGKRVWSVLLVTREKRPALSTYYRHRSFMDNKYGKDWGEMAINSIKILDTGNMDKLNTALGIKNGRVKKLPGEPVDV